MTDSIIINGKEWFCQSHFSGKLDGEYLSILLVWGEGWRRTLMRVPEKGEENDESEAVALTPEQREAIRALPDETRMPEPMEMVGKPYLNIRNLKSWSG